ncbi:MAG: alpha-E domain-containing protein [Uliginosibacterium sp.]|nr:alpha-E domain-containing protein [Uliginosibacterium sp.]
MPQSEREVERPWRETLDSAGVLDSYYPSHENRVAVQKSHFMALDRKNPGRIYPCLRAAQRTRTRCGTPTSGAVETINATWHELRGYDISQMGADEMHSSSG